MNKQELENYYFPTEKTKKVKKYLPKIIKFVKLKNFFVDPNLDNNERILLQDKIQNQIQVFLRNNIDIYFEISFIYKLNSLVCLSEILIQVVCAYLAIKSKKDYNIFLFPNSILYFENTYPPNILQWKQNNKLNIFDYCNIYSKLLRECDE